MAITTLKLDQEQIFKVLNNFWDQYKQRDILGKYWEGLAQVLDNEYLQIFQANQSKSLDLVPVEWHYQWIPFDLEVFGSGLVVHDHFFLKLTAAGGETLVSLPGAVDAKNVLVYLNGVLLSTDPLPAPDFNFLSVLQQVEFTSALSVSDEVFITWLEEGDSNDRKHEHKFFEETLSAGKSSWTNAAGDAFNDAQAGPYDSGSTVDPIEVYVNGLQQPSSAYTETSDAQLDLSVALVATDHILFNFRIEDLNADLHAHNRFTEIVSASKSKIDLPFNIDSGRAFVYLNGLLQIIGTDYTETKPDQINFTATLSANDIVEVDSLTIEIQLLVDNSIVRIPVLQNGIDEEATNPPTLCFFAGVDYNIVKQSGSTFIVTTNLNLVGKFWAPDLFVNELVVQNNFGEPIQFIRDNSEFYRIATQGLWLAFWNGPNVTILENSTSIILGLPFATADAIVQQITVNMNGTTTIDLNDGNSHILPDFLSPIVSIGDSVEKFDALSDGVRIIDNITDPIWLKLIDNLAAKIPNKLTTSGPISERFDDGGTIDDAGVFDAILDDNEVDTRLFEAFKHFVWIVDIQDARIFNQTLLPNVDDPTDQVTVQNDLLLFLDSIKPAYTQYIFIGDLPFSDIFPAFTDEFSMAPENTFLESLCAFDDGGNWDTDGPINGFTAGAGQAVFSLNPVFPYTVGGGDLKVFVDQVLQTITVDYLETDSLTVTFTSGLSGGEEVIIYEDDATTDALDNRCMRDEVTLVLA